MSKRGELEEIASRLAEVRESVAVFERWVAEVGIPLDQELATTVARELIEEKTALQLSQEALTNLESELTSITKRINELEQKRAQQAEARERAVAAIMPLEHQSADLRAKAEESGLSLEMTAEELAAETLVFTTRKAGGEERIGEVTSQLERTVQTTDEVERQISEVEDNIEILRQYKELLEKRVRAYEENTASVIDRNALSLDTIRERRRLATERVDGLDELRIRCITVERTLDAAQRSARLAELEAHSQFLAKQKETFVEEAERMSVEKRWFTSVNCALDRESSSAIANHVDAFGPLTTLIQKRLHAVYGFGDISLLPERNSIRVVVGWGTKHVKPADYFSESQKQILMLSIFLASRLTQTWSGFAPVMMDDPVTHFDDLNAFGFVELIRGLVTNSPSEHQFFVSTCEERLFELMVKKFDNVKGGAKFYRFEGIGPGGPIVREIG